MSEIPIDELMERIRAEVKHREANAGSENRTAPQSFPARNPLPKGNSSPNSENFETKDAYHINELLRFRDRNFVMFAYRGILKRGPDAAGLKYFLDNLRSGKMTKAEVLGRLRYAPEGRRKQTKIKGLFWNFVIQSSFRIPVLGYATRLVTGIGNLPAILHNLRMFEERATLQSESQQNELSRMQSKSEEITQHFAELKENIVRLAVLQNEMAGAIEQKAGRSELDGLKSDVGTALEKKADWAAMNELNSSIHSQLENKANQDDVRDIGDQIKGILLQTRDHKRNILDQQRRLMLLLEEARKRLPEPISEDQIKQMLKEEDHLLDAMYASFEDQFRGTREDIKQRQTIYLPYIREVEAGTAEAPIIDLGCGRGEWLELLTENQKTAVGLDINRIFVSECLELGLNVVEGEALAYLRSLKASSLGAITAFHLIEHLPLNKLITLLDESLRVLRPGGILILETPNPENLMVGAYSFYFDPTHRNPLPPDTTRYLLEARSFGRCEIVRLHPVDEIARDQNIVNTCSPSLMQLIYGPQDYAVVAKKNSK